MAINFKDPKVIALGVGGLVLLWYFFLRKPGAASVQQQPGNNLPATTNPQQPINQPSPSSDNAASSGDILNLLGNVVDDFVNSENILAGFAATTNQQFYGIAQSANAGLVDLATQVVNHPPVITTIYYPVGPAGGGSTSAGSGGGPAPNVGSASTFVPSFGQNYGTGTGQSPQPAPPSYYSVSAGSQPQIVRHGAGMGGPQS